MAEINYALKNLYKTDLPWTDYDFHLADVMSSSWANFVKTGDPSSGGSYANGNSTRWPPNRSERPTVMHLGDGFGEVPVATRERRELLSALMKRHEPY